jgi:asparagine synthase (glutamine-hydrolysing)
MCGFLGIYRRGATEAESREDAARLKALSSLIDNRGPDDSGFYGTEGLTLVTSRLAMIAGSEGGQPMHSSDRRLVIALNGELYDQSAVRVALRRRYSFKTLRSDTEALCAVALIGGVSALADVDGQYAAALFDSQAKRLTLVRDRFGIHPLYYARRNGVFYFGSSASAVASLIGVGLSPYSVYLSLSLWGIPDPRSIYEGVSSVRPGFAIEVEGGDLREVSVDPIVFPSEGEEELGLDEEELREALTAAIVNRLDADAPLGMLSSGGVDSGVVARMTHRAGHEVPAYFIASTDRADGELSVVSSTVEACGHDLRVLSPSADDLAENLRSGVLAAGAPLWRTGPLGFDLLAQRIRQDGVRGVLTGDGADELFCGYDVFRIALARRAIGSEDPDIRSAGLNALGTIPSARALARTTAPPMALAPFGSDDVVDSHLPRWRAFGGMAQFLLAPEHRGLALEHTCIDYMRDQMGPQLRPLSPMNRARLLEITTLFQGFLISSQSDRPLMNHGVEGRYPFLSRAVADIAIRTDPAVMCNLSMSKIPVRRLLDDGVMSASAMTPKRPYHPGTVLGSLAFQALCDEYLSSQAIEAVGVFEHQRVTQVLNATQRSDRPRPVDVAALLTVVSTQVLAHG